MLERPAFSKIFLITQSQLLPSKVSPVVLWILVLKAQAVLPVKHHKEIQHFTVKYELVVHIVESCVKCRERLPAHLTQILFGRINNLSVF